MPELRIDSPPEPRDVYTDEAGVCQDAEGWCITAKEWKRRALAAEHLVNLSRIEQLMDAKENTPEAEELLRLAIEVEEYEDLWPDFIQTPKLAATLLVQPTTSGGSPSPA